MSFRLSDSLASYVGKLSASHWRALLCLAPAISVTPCLARDAIGALAPEADVGMLRGLRLADFAAQSGGETALLEPERASLVYALLDDEALSSTVLRWYLDRLARDASPDAELGDPRWCRLRASSAYFTSLLHGAQTGMPVFWEAFISGGMEERYLVSRLVGELASLGIEGCAVNQLYFTALLRCQEGRPTAACKLLSEVIRRASSPAEMGPAIALLAQIGQQALADGEEVEPGRKGKQALNLPVPSGDDRPEPTAILNPSRRAPSWGAPEASAVWRLIFDDYPHSRFISQFWAAYFDSQLNLDRVLCNLERCELPRQGVPSRIEYMRNDVARSIIYVPMLPLADTDIFNLAPLSHFRPETHSWGRAQPFTQHYHSRSAAWRTSEWPRGERYRWERALSELLRFWAGFWLEQARNEDAALADGTIILKSRHADHVAPYYKEVWMKYSADERPWKPGHCSGTEEPDLHAARSCIDLLFLRESFTVRSLTDDLR